MCIVREGISCKISDYAVCFYLGLGQKGKKKKKNRRGGRRRGWVSEVSRLALY